MKNTSLYNSHKIEFLSLKAVNEPYEAEIKQAMSEVVDSGWYVLGKNVRQFEKDWAEYCGTRYCVGCGNGLDALRLVLMAWMELGKIAPGDEVIVPANTYIATILAVSDCGLTPVPVEPDPETMLLSPENIADAITARTRVILPVHLYGQRCEIDELVKDRELGIDALIRDKGLLILEDCAQAHGVTVQESCFMDHGPNNIAHHTPHIAQSWSFYPTKNLGALGDAGAVTTDDAELAEMVRKIANYGSASRYVNDVKGVNSRMDELQAAILSIKLKDLDRCNERRREIAHRYNTEICNPLIVLPKVKTESVYHLYTVRCEQRDELQQYLAQRGIETQVHYPTPPHKQGAYKEWAELSFPISEKIAQTILSIPCNPALTNEEVDRIIKALNTFDLHPSSIIFNPEP